MIQRAVVPGVPGKAEVLAAHLRAIEVDRDLLQAPFRFATARFYDRATPCDIHARFCRSRMTWASARPSRPGLSPGSYRCGGGGISSESRLHLR